MMVSLSLAIRDLTKMGDGAQEQSGLRNCADPSSVQHYSLSLLCSLARWLDIFPYLDHSSILPRLIHTISLL